MRLSVSMLSPTNNEKNLRICFEARKIIKNNPFPFFSLPLFPLFCFEVRAELSSGCHCRLSGHRLAKLVDCFCSRFKQLRCVYALCAWQFVCVCTSIVPLGQFVCIIIYYAKSCVKIAVASFLLCPNLSPPFLPCLALHCGRGQSTNFAYVCVCAKPANVSIHQTVTAVGPAPEGRMRESQTKTAEHET